MASTSGAPASAAPSKPPIWKRCLWGGLVLAVLFVIHRVDRAAATPWLATGLLLLLGGLASFEFGMLLRSAGHAAVVAWCGVLGSALLVSKAALLVWWPQVAAADCVLSYLVACLLVLCAREVIVGEPARGFPRLAGVLLGLLYLTLYSFLFDLLLRGGAPFGVDFAVYLVLVSKANDIGGYLGGSLIGGRKLAPRVSPNKTWSGSLAGVVLSLTIAAVGAPLVGWPESTGVALLFGLAVSIATQFGDLSESLFKRACGTKDSAQLVPTFGGALDIIDSLVFAAPVGYWFVIAVGAVPA